MLRVAVAPVLVVAALVYAHLAGSDQTASIVLYVAAAGAIFTQVAEPIQGGFQAIERMEYLAYSDVINKSAQGLAGVCARPGRLRRDRHHRGLGGDDGGWSWCST